MQHRFTAGARGEGWQSKCGHHGHCRGCGKSHVEEARYAGNLLTQFTFVSCPRPKPFLIDTQPPPREESAFYLDEALTMPVLEGEIYTEDNVTLALYLKPVEDYFSANPWPSACKTTASCQPCASKCRAYSRCG